jgi:pimeloyl-ACP methyl ester carboxylesterase
MYYTATRSGIFLTKRGVKLRYTRFGVGPEPLIVIPGIDDAVQNLHRASRFWAWYFRPLAASGRTVYLVSRARGLPAQVDLHELAEVYAEIIEREFRSADVLGISLGGMIAQHLALSRPELVRRLVLAVTAHRLTDEGHAHGQELMALASSGRWRKFAARANALCFSGYLRQTIAVALWLTAPLTSLLEQRARGSARGRAASDFCSSARACARHDTEALLGQLAVPTLIWSAQGDPLFPISSVKQMVDLLPGGRLVTVDGAHAAFLQQRSKFQRTVLKFLAATPEPS